MVGRLLLLSGSRLGGADFQVAVNLATVGVNYFAVKPLGQRDGQPGLARCGGAEDGYRGMQLAARYLAAPARLTISRNCSACKLAPPTRAPCIGLWPM